MIITCPVCGTRYLVAEQALGQPGDRAVRCSSCGHTWREPVATQPRGEEPVPQAATRGVGARDARPAHPEPVRPPPAGSASFRAEPIRPGLVHLDLVRSEPVQPKTERQSRARRRDRLRRVAVAVPVLIAAAILAALFARDEVVAWWPATAPLYAMIDLPIEVPGAGLEIDRVSPSRGVDGLVIEGDVVDTSGLARAVPRLRVALQDATQKEVQFKIVDPPQARLWPGEAVHFRAAFPHPDEAATGVVVTFAAH